MDNLEKLGPHIAGMLKDYDPLFVKLLTPIMIKLATLTLLREVCSGDFKGPALEPYMKRNMFTQEKLESIRDNKENCLMFRYEHAKLTELVLEVPEVLEIIQKVLPGVDVVFSDKKGDHGIS